MEGSPLIFSKKWKYFAIPITISIAVERIFTPFPFAFPLSDFRAVSISAITISISSNTDCRKLLPERWLCLSQSGVSVEVLKDLKSFFLL